MLQGCWKLEEVGKQFHIVFEGLKMMLLLIEFTFAVNKSLCQLFQEINVDKMSFSWSLSALLE